MFVFSKIFTWFLSPLPYIFICLGLFIVFSRKALPFYFRLLSGIITFVCLCLASPWASHLLLQWEDPLSKTQDLGFLEDQTFDALVVLGGSVITTAEDFSQVSLNDSAERLFEAARLWRLGYAPLIVLSGGSAEILDHQQKEAPLMAQLLEDLGVPTDCLVQESESRNTWENALHVKELLQARGYHKVLLVSSALHMKRSKAIFEKLEFIDLSKVQADSTASGLYFYPWSCDSRKKRLLFLEALVPQLEALRESTLALKEIVGFAAYRVLGRL